MRDADFQHVLETTRCENSAALVPAHPFGSVNAMQDLVSCVVRASRHCKTTQNYIQAIQTPQGVCLATNVIRKGHIDMTTIASGWAIGRSSTCAIRIFNNSISRCHAIIGHHPETGFYVTDLDSSNGSWLNGQRLVKMQRYALKAGDVLTFGKLSMEFLVDVCGEGAIACPREETYF